LDADLDGKHELGGEFLVTGNASLEDNLVATDAVDELHDSGHEGTHLPEKNCGNSGVKDEQLDKLLERLGNFHLCFSKALISSRDLPSVSFESRWS
jgi:hypothetical protein